MNAAPYWAHFRISTKEDFRYFFSDSLIGSGSYIIHIGVVILFYFATQKTLFFGLFTWPMIVWYVIITQFLMSNQSNIISVLSRQIQNGNIVTHMNKPYHYPLALFGQHAGSVFVESLGLMLFAIPLGLIIVGTGPLTMYGVLFGILAIILAFMLDYVLSVSLGLIAFWTEDAKPYQWIYGKFLFVFGGLLFPLEVYPAWAQSIAKMLPTAFLMYYPARLVVDFSWDLLLTVLLGQAIYLCIFTLIAYWIYRRALRMVSINGG